MNDLKPKIQQTVLYGGMALAAILITVTGILWKQAFLRMLPLYVSLVVSFLQSKANRTASLIGGLNSLLYAAVFAYYHLYGSMVYAILVSCPIQILTFIRWKKHSYKKTTMFRKLTTKSRLLVAGGFVVVWVGVYLVLNAIGSNFVLIDNTMTLLGILTSFLTMFAYIEYSVLMIPSSLVNILLYSLMLKENPEQATFLVYSIYCFICQCFAFMNIRRLYKEQTESSKQT